MQLKDIPDAPILAFLSSLDRWATWSSEGDNSVLSAMPEGTSEKLACEKMKGMIRRGLVDGCTCGCRGDYVITETGRLSMLQGAECQS